MSSRLSRKSFSHILEDLDKADFIARVFNYFLILLILANVLAVMLATVESIAQQYRLELFVFEVFSVAIFSIEYALRVWSSVELYPDDIPPWKARLKYVFSLMAIIDLLAILPFYLGLFFELDLRFLRVMRLLRVFKLGRYSFAMQMLLDVLRREFKTFIAIGTVLLVLMVIASSGIYLIEHKVQPDKFGSIPESMWWAMATLTTVGYGDVVPITPIGKFFGGMITLMSMGMVALPAGILASSFSEELRKRREKFRVKVKEAMADGIVTQNELDQLEKLRKSLNLDRDDAEALFNLLSAKKAHVKQCPKCGHTISPPKSPGP